MRTKFWPVNPKRRDHAEGLGIDGKIILERILRRQCEKVWTGFIWLKISGIALGYRLNDQGSSPSRGWEFLSSPPRPDRLWGPPSLLSNW
jgi:hypothetical protein